MAEHSKRSTSDDAEAMNNSRQFNAAEQVLNTFELVEAILLQLPLEDILLMSNIFDFICQVIERSNPLTIRFKRTIGGYDKKFELRNGDSWSDNISFAFFRDFRATVYTEDTRMFVSRIGQWSAIAKLNQHEGRVKIANGRNMQVTFQRVSRFEWDIKIIDFETSQTFKHHMALPQRPLDEEIFLTCYMMRFHGEPRFTYED